MTDEQPNIVYFFWDNFGWGELGCYGDLPARLGDSPHGRRRSVPHVAGEGAPDQAGNARSLQLGLAEHAVVTGILWALFGAVAGTLYGLWAGRAISARRIKPPRPLLPPDTSMAVCWAEGEVSHDRIAEWSAPATDHLIMRFEPAFGGALLEV